MTKAEKGYHFLTKHRSNEDRLMCGQSAYSVHVICRRPPIPCRDFNAGEDENEVEARATAAASRAEGFQAAVWRRID
jgi:hypothetical protein